MKREVAARLQGHVEAPARLVLQIAVAEQPGLDVADMLTVTVGGAVMPLERLSAPTGGWLHVLDAPVGEISVSYEATVVGRADPVPDRPHELIDYLRPSRYAESDRLAQIAEAEFGRLEGPEQLLAGVSSWVGDRLTYVSGSSGPTDGAVDTLLAGTGVCRDYAHLVVAFLRARDVPARLAAVYAPGLWPMDFHAVAEAYVDGGWRVVDATLLAPRSSLLRISTGRDAADTAFLSNYGGNVSLYMVEVNAVVYPSLPTDDVTSLVTLG
jgi:transglutaminase-like putative cysteine protease